MEIITSKKRIETITLTPKEEQKIEDVISLLTTIKGTYQDIFRKNGEIWCTGSYPNCIDRLADVAWRVSMVRTRLTITLVRRCPSQVSLKNRQKCLFFT